MVDEEEVLVVEEEEDEDPTTSSGPGRKAAQTPSPLVPSGRSFAIN